APRRREAQPARPPAQDIQDAHRRLHDVAGLPPARSLHDQRNPNDLLEEGMAVVETAVLVELLPVVRDIDDQRRLPEASALELLSQRRELIVRLPDES